MSGVVNQQFAMTGESMCFGNGLRGGTAVLEDDVLVADHMEIFAQLLSVGDVVFRGGESAEIIVCMQQGQTLAALVDVMIFVRTLF